MYQIKVMITAEAEMPGQKFSKRYYTGIVGIPGKKTNIEKAKNTALQGLIASIQKENLDKKIIGKVISCDKIKDDFFFK